MRRLHIGGNCRTDGWEVFDICPGPHVDHVGDASDLSRFGDGTFDWVYCSHVLEHFPLHDAEKVLAEWRRVLADGGALRLSVPDLEVLCRLYLNKAYPLLDRVHVMRIMFGGQINEYDFHYSGYDCELLYALLKKAGFSEVERVRTHDLFEDSSDIKFDDYKISLNLIAHKGERK